MIGKSISAMAAITLATLIHGCASDALKQGSQAAVASCLQCPEMQRIPAGTFTMGYDGGEPGRYEGPPHQVVITRDFWMAETEVTHGQFSAFVAATGYQQAPGCNVWPKGTLAFEKASWRTPGYETQLNYPAACVSWTDAQAYIAWLSAQSGLAYRLPTEAEWEYAAAAGSADAFPWGAELEDGCAHANWYDISSAGTFRWDNSSCSDGHDGPSPVASYQANAFGLYDMIGNVWEWTQDCYIVPYPSNHTTEAAVEPAAGAQCDRRSVRGGSWMTRPSRNRIHFRGRDPEETRYFMFGFRLARDIAPVDGRETAP